MTLPNSDLSGMADWAEALIASRAPDLTIGGEQNPYLRRWYVIPRNAWGNIYLHEILRSDDDHALHDHPWSSRSFVLSGGYWEHTPLGVWWRGPGSIIEREARGLHRLELDPTRATRALSLFTTGAREREWGFQCPQGWRHWREFTAGENGELMGPGCD